MNEGQNLPIEQWQRNEDGRVFGVLAVVVGIFVVIGVVIVKFLYK